MFSFLCRCTFPLNTSHKMTLMLCVFYFVAEKSRITPINMNAFVERAQKVGFYQIYIPAKKTEHWPRWTLNSAEYCFFWSVYSFFGVFSIFMSVRLIKIEKSEIWYLKLPIACFYTFRAKKNWFFLWKFEVRTDFPKKKFTPKKEWANSKIFEWDLSFWNHFKTCQNWCQLH